jgi:hypothetical protein
MKEYRKEETLKIMSILGYKPGWTEKELSLHGKSLIDLLAFLDELHELTKGNLHEFEINSRPNGTVDLIFTKEAEDFVVRLNFNNTETYGVFIKDRGQALLDESDVSIDSPESIDLIYKYVKSEKALDH